MAKVLVKLIETCGDCDFFRSEASGSTEYSSNCLHHDYKDPEGFRLFLWAACVPPAGCPLPDAPEEEEDGNAATGL